MPDGLYDTAAGMVAAQRLYEVAAQNLANLRVHGYRRRAVQIVLEPGPSGGIAMAGEPRIDFSPGSYQQTGNPLDVAIADDGFFVLEGPTGPLYTRAGIFLVDSTGRLVTPSGYQVTGTGGPITVPLQAGAVRILEDGTVTAGGQPVGQLRVVRFQNVDQLRPVGPSLFEDPGQASAEPVENPRLVPGTREGSNVEPIIDLVQLILATRFYEASQRALQGYSVLIQTATNELL